ncbi:hypothetical protein [Arthrobacter sp. HS15c]|uniref:hypothetical protein n=1 Tax=Arthrobacter sp. HS15c TaxID=3230279 RepID=UPI00346666C6
MTINPLHRRLLEIVDSGAIGEVRSVRASWVPGSFLGQTLDPAEPLSQCDPQFKAGNVLAQALVWGRSRIRHGPWTSCEAQRVGIIKKREPRLADSSTSATCSPAA